MLSTSYCDIDLSSVCYDVVLFFCKVDSIFKIVGFVSIYYTIKMNIVSSCMIFNNLYLDLLFYYKFELILQESIILFFFNNIRND